MGNIERKLFLAFKKEGILPEHQISIMGFLDRLKKKDYYAYEHSIRVGLLSAKIGHYLNVNPRELLFQVLHDIGKLDVPDRILKKKASDLTKAERKIMQKHVWDSYNRIKDAYPPAIAAVSLLHHYYQFEGYPKKIPEIETKFRPKTLKKIKRQAMLVAFADVYDAATTRPAKMHNYKKPRTPAEAKLLLMKKFPEQREIIMDLYRAKVFGGKGKISGKKIRANRFVRKKRFPPGRTIIQAGGRIIMRPK
jgi:HD-GYP domain-containing protein (c-di-GMP phosphodiesterase class II)